MSNNNPSLEDKKKKKKSSFREYAEAIAIAVLIALFIRSFGLEAFKIPSSSMIPTLMIGDHIFVNKFVYGLRLPLTKYRFLEFKKPERGDFIVFMYPKDEGKDYIKRVIGLPGDEVEIDDDNVYVNGEEVKRDEVEVKNQKKKEDLTVVGSEDYKKIPYFKGWKRFTFYEQDLDDKDFLIQYEDYAYRNKKTFTVPEDYYFVMGDNRDNSSDSREWGFVPDENVKGKAMFVWLSLDKDRGGIRFNRFGKWIK